MKRMLRLAAEEGYDKVAWTTGEQQADRYDMSREIESIQSEDETITEASDGTPIAKALTIRTTSGMDIRMDVDANGMVRGGEYNGKQISDVLGKELGEKVMEKGNHTLTTPDLKLGGEGMKGFYDKILPTFMNKYGKKWGVKTESVELPSLGDNGLTMHSVDVTPEMRESVMQGQTLFRFIGEQEAMNLDKAEERSQSLASETEDVSREDQIFIYDGLNSQSDVRFSIGGNSGYVGYSMSKRAAQAREEGRYPKTDFLKEYGVSTKALQPLVDAGIISDREWHHTSKYGNKTTFYGWEEKEYADIYQEHKKEINDLITETANLKKELDTIMNSEEYKTSEGVRDNWDKKRKEYWEKKAKLSTTLKDIFTQQSNEGVRFSLSSSNKSVERYDKQNGTNVKGFFNFLRNGKVAQTGEPKSFHIADAGELLQQYGIKGKFMVGDFTFSATHTQNADHDLGVKEWVDVINNLNNPLAIASYKGLPNEYRIYTYATINGKNICVGVNVSLKDGRIALSRILSAYGRDIENLLKGEKKYLLYPASIKELEQRISQGSTTHNSWLNATSSAQDDAKVIKDFENPTLEAEKNTDTTTFDSEAGVNFRLSSEIESEYPNWLEGTTTDSGKHSTQVTNTRKTYNKVADWIENNLGKDVSILDASSGMGLGTADLRERGFNIEDVEPYQSEERKENNPATYSSYDDINKQYDYIISNAVLNVIPDDWRQEVLHNMASKLKEGGKLFINTRKAGEEKFIKDKIELDSPQEVLVKRNGKIASYQRFFTPQELKQWVEQELGEGYSVEVANQSNSGTSGLAAVVVTKTPSISTQADATLFRIEEESSEAYNSVMNVELPKAETPIEVAKNKQTERTLFRFDKDFASMIALQNAIRNTELYKYNTKGKLEELNKGLFDSMSPLLDLIDIQPQLNYFKTLLIYRFICCIFTQYLKTQQWIM